MNRQPSVCDFCGLPEPLIPYDEPGFNWYACPECTQLIENKQWAELANRCFEAFDARLSSSDEHLLEAEAQALVTAFRECLPTVPC